MEEVSDRVLRREMRHLSRCRLESSAIFRSPWWRVRLQLAFFKEVLQLLFFVKVVVAQRQIPMVWGVLKTIEILQVQFFDKVVPSLPRGSFGCLVQFLDKVGDVPVAVHVGMLKTLEVPQLQFMDKVAVQTLASGGYGGLAVFERFFSVFTPSFGLLFGVDSLFSAHFSKPSRANSCWPSRAPLHK